jgi:hypothetical protein
MAPGDGHCLIHSVAFACYLPYATGKLDGRVVDRNKIVKRFRSDMANRLEKIDIETGKKFNDIINDGALAELGTVDPEYYSLQSLQNLLRSDKYLGPEIIIILENILELNIYVLDARFQDVVQKDNKKIYDLSIVIYYSDHHYDCISRRVGSEGIHVRLFKRDDSFIEFLRTRIETRPKNYADDSKI